MQARTNLEQSSVDRYAQNIAGRAQAALRFFQRGRDKSDMTQMDTNNDGLASKEEFMKFHEKMFDMMKNKDGVVDLKEMHKCCKGMMGGMEGGMMGGDIMQHHQMGKPKQ